MSYGLMKAILKQSRFELIYMFSIAVRPAYIYIACKQSSWHMLILLSKNIC